MITPVFKLHQDAKFLLVNIRVPYAKLDEVDIFVDGNDFRFHCKPYFLRLNLPGRIVDNVESESGTYDFEEKMFKFKFEKEKEGEMFEGLDMITKLLQPMSGNANKSAGPIAPLIEELSEDTASKEKNEGDEDDADEEEDDEIEWFIEQQANVNEKDDSELDVNLTTGPRIKYGFAGTKSNVFSKLGSEYSMVIDLPDPDTTAPSERTELRKQSEEDKFDQDHYLADFFDDSDMIESVLLEYAAIFSDEPFTDEEIDRLKSLPNKNYLLDKNETFRAFAGLVDILFAYCYDNRANCGDSTNVESGWTIAKLSSTLCWFDSFDSLEEVLVAAFRRSVCFPLYRNWKLSKAVLDDLIQLLSKGRKAVIRALLAIRCCFIDGECRYILNDLYINDYCVWIQHVSESKISKLADCLKKIKIDKRRLGLDLQCIELAGKLALQESEKGEASSDEESGEEHIERSISPGLLANHGQAAACSNELVDEITELKLSEPPKSKKLIEEL